MVPMTIADPSGSFVPPEVSCEGAGQRDLAPVPPVSAGSPEAMIRSSLVGVLPGDRIENEGYPDDGRLWFTILRDRLPIAVVRLIQREQLLGISMVTVCDGSGISEGDPHPASSPPSTTS
jgi:hypothetical protein